MIVSNLAIDCNGQGKALGEVTLIVTMIVIMIVTVMHSGKHLH
jgi:hypothetical protein